MAPLFKIAALLNLSLYVAAQGTQFITGECSSDADCASACCGFNTGKCAGAVVAQERDGGCGFGDAQPNDIAAQALTGGAGNNNNNANANADQVSAAAQDDNNTSAAGAGNAQGTQFITGECSSDADCASACCGFNSGKCAGPAVAQERDGGCGFGDAQPNDDALQALNGGNANANANNNANANANANNGDNVQAQDQGQTGGAGAGNGAGTQFITGECSSDADCGSGCCGFNSGKCAGPVVAQERDGGCGFGDAQPNDNAAQALQGRRFGRRGVAFM